MPKPHPNGIDKDLGARIKLARQQADMSQTTLGKHLGVSFQQVQKYENGTNRVSATNLAKIAALLGVPLHQLLDGTAKQKGRSPELDNLVATIEGIKNRNMRLMVIRMARSMAQEARAS